MNIKDRDIRWMHAKLQDVWHELYVESDQFELAEKVEILLKKFTSYLIEIKEKENDK